MPQNDDLTSIEVDNGKTTESVLKRIWLRTFGPKGQDTNQNVLHIGIGFRRIVRLSKEIDAEIGIKIPPTTIMRLGTIKVIAAAIDTQIWPQISPLIMLKDGLRGEALYVVAAGGGVALELCDLASLIDFPGRIYGLQLPGLDGETKPLSSIEAIAQFYVDAVLSVNDREPFHIIGYSFGGLVAYEMARILAAQNKHIGLLGLLDTTCFEKYWPLTEWLSFAVKQTFRRLLEVKKMTAYDATIFLKSRIIAAIRYFNRRLDDRRRNASLHESIYYVAGLEEEVQRVRHASIIAFEAYRPTVQVCEAILYKSMLGDPHACNPVKIWNRLVSKLEVVSVPGTHTTMIRKPFAEHLAAKISEHLRAQTNSAKFQSSKASGCLAYQPCPNGFFRNQSLVEWFLQNRTVRSLPTAITAALVRCKRIIVPLKQLP